MNYCCLDDHKTWLYVCIDITDSYGRTDYKQARFLPLQNAYKRNIGYNSKKDAVPVT